MHLLSGTVLHSSVEPNGQSIMTGSTTCRLRGSFLALALPIAAGFIIVQGSPLSATFSSANNGAAANVNLSVLSYVVELQVDDANTFDTKSIIRVNATGLTNVTVFNVKDLTVDQKVTVTNIKNGARVVVLSLNLLGDDLLEIRLAAQLRAGVEYEIVISATGQFGAPSGFGLTRVPFPADSGQHSWMVAFRGSPTSARRLFACVDDLDGVANVTLKVWRPSTHTAISNARLNKTEHIGGVLCKDTFAPARLAPHQLRLVVAPLLQGGDANATVSAWTTPWAAPAANYIQRFVTTMNNLTENLSGLPLALQHLSVVALPGIEEPASRGLVALDEDDVVGVLEASPPSSRRDALLQLAEAVSQLGVRTAQPPRWEEAWVYYGLGAHLRHRYAEQAVSGWRLLDAQITSQVQAVLEAAAWSSDTALTATTLRAGGVTHNNRAAADKAAVLLRMVESFVPPKAFDTAVRSFYQLSVQQAVGANDLWESFTSSLTGEDENVLPVGGTVPRIMSSWTSSPGYPVVFVIRDYETNTVNVSQKGFSWSRLDTEVASEWCVPLSYTYARERENDRNPSAKPRRWMVPWNYTQIDDLYHLAPYDWVYFNLYQSAPYRVNYDVINWRMLTTELLGVRFDAILPPTARAHLLGDSLALARAGELDYALALNLAEYIRQEDDLLPWQVARQSLAFLENLLENEGLLLLREFEASLLKDVYLDSQFQMSGASVSPDVGTLRELAATWACEAGLPQCLEYVDGLYRQWRDQDDPPLPDFVEAVLCRAVSEVGEDALNFTLGALRGKHSGGALVGGQRRSYVRAAGCAPSEPLLIRVIEDALSASGSFRASEVIQLLTAASNSKSLGWWVVVDYLLHDHARIAERTAAFGDMEALSFHLASKVTSQDKQKTLLAAVEAADASLFNAILKATAVNLAWVERHHEEVMDWLRVAIGPPTSLPPITEPPPTSPTTNVTVTPQVSSGVNAPALCETLVIVINIIMLVSSLHSFE